MSCAQNCDFAGNYECSRLQAVKVLELQVLGSDYGGTSWTTSNQAGHILSSLALDSNSRLLEIGSGSGWPGLFLSDASGCEVTLLDMPLNALALAAERARSDGTIERVHLVNGDGTALPFADDSYGYLSHSDVLCCLPEKLKMLQECRRVAIDGARMHFSVIKPAPGLASADHQKVLDTGPPYVDVSGSYSQLLRQSDWRLLERVDVTAEYANSLQKLAAGLRQNTPELQRAFGATELRDLWRHREDQLTLVRAGMLQRVIYVAN